MNIIFFPYSQSITSKFVVPKLIVISTLHRFLMGPFASYFSQNFKKMAKLKYNTLGTISQVPLLKLKHLSIYLTVKLPFSSPSFFFFLSLVSVFLTLELSPKTLCQLLGLCYFEVWQSFSLLIMIQVSIFVIGSVLLLPWFVLIQVFNSSCWVCVIQRFGRVFFWLFLIKVSNLVNGFVLVLLQLILIWVFKYSC